MEELRRQKPIRFGRAIDGMAQHEHDGSKSKWLECEKHPSHFDSTLFEQSGCPGHFNLKPIVIQVWHWVTNEVNIAKSAFLYLPEGK